MLGIEHRLDAGEVPLERLTAVEQEPALFKPPLPDPQTSLVVLEVMEYLMAQARAKRPLNPRNSLKNSVFRARRLDPPSRPFLNLWKLTTCVSKAHKKNFQARETGRAANR